MNKIIGYRLLEKADIMKAGDVLGSVSKKKIGEEWIGVLVSQCNQPVYRPMIKFIDWSNINEKTG